MFKLTRLWNLNILEDQFKPRDIPPEKRDFSARFPDDNKLVVLFDPSVEYQLIDLYGPGCFTETEGGLLLETGFTNRGYTIGWLLGFGGKAKVLEPSDIAEDIRAAARGILERY